MTDTFDFQALEELVARFFLVEERVIGGEKQRFILRLSGHLKDADSARAYDQLAAEIKPLGLIPRFYTESGKHVIILMKSMPQLRPLNPYVNLVLFILTLLSVLFTGGLYSLQSELPADTTKAVLLILSQGWPFAVAMLSILAVHEFGHYFAGRRNGVQVTLPYFIPFPLSAFGTLGAFINMRSLPKNKRALFDLAVTGPLSGFIVSVIVLIIGLNLSTLNQLPLSPAQGVGLQMEGNSLLYLALKFLVFGKLLPNPSGLKGISQVIYWLQYFFTGRPFPWGSLDVSLHPVAWAGWAGLFVTTINLIPAGQLDGGHIFSSLFGKESTRHIFPYILAGLVMMGFFWNVWWVWAVLIFLMSRFYAEPLDQITQLDVKRKQLGWLALLIFVITFIPVPLNIVTP